MKNTMRTKTHWLAGAPVLWLLGVLAVSLLPHVALAHGGEDHGEAKPAVVAGTSPRFEAQSDLFEIVAIPTGAGTGKLLIYLSDVLSNAPIAKAAIEVTRADTTVKAIEAKGIYEIAAPWVTTPGHYDLTFAVTAADASDLLIGTLNIPDPPAASARHDSLWDHLRPQWMANLSIPSWMTAVAAALALLMVGLSIRMTGPARRAGLALATFAGMSSIALATVMLLHSAHYAPPQNAILDLPETARRTDDGSIFVPKATQRLLDVTTLLTAPAETAQKTVRLIGQVIPDINRSGLVQALLPGRIMAPEGGFAAIGAHVKSGDVLGYLTPRVELKDQSDIRQTTGDLDRQVSLAEAKLSRLERLKNVVSESSVSDAHLELEGLRKRRTTINPVLGGREALLAPVDGIVAQANVVSGQVVEAQTLLFQIIDPENLWVEALAFDPAAASSIERASREAVAKSADGREANLVFSGRGLTLKQQAIPLRFKIKGRTSGFSIGEPVSVDAPIDEAIAAIPLPRSSIVRSSNGQSIVWVHAKAERFEQRVVVSEPIDADRVGITAGLEPDTRVVVRGAELINQVW